MKKLFLVVCLALGLALAQDPNLPGRPGPNDALVRFAHLVEGGPKVDVLVGDKRAFEELAYKDVTPYAPVAAGEVTFAVVEATKTGPKLTEVKVRLEAGKRYTIAAMGTAQKLMGQALNDDFKAAPDQATVRVVHASADTGAVEVAVKGGSALSKGLAFGKTSAFVPLKEGTYDLEVRPAGKAEVALPLSGLAFASGRVYTVFVVGSSANGSLDAVVTEDTFSLQ